MEESLRPLFDVELKKTDERKRNRVVERTENTRLFANDGTETLFSRGKSYVLILDL